jgi:tetratricopeptide (TPR) repeat protein
MESWKHAKLRAIELRPIKPRPVVAPRRHWRRLYERSLRVKVALPSRTIQKCALANRLCAVKTSLMALLVGASLLCGISSAAPTSIPTTQQTIQSLRLSLATDFANPNEHLELSQSIQANGDPLTAFCICEYARSLFGEEAFAGAFDTVFRGHVSDVLFHPRKEALRQAIKLAPGNIALMRQLADLYASHGEPAEAADELEKASRLAPEDFSLVDAARTDLIAAGKTSDGQSLVNVWCEAHPDSAPTWARNIQQAIDQNSDSVGDLLNQAIAKFPEDGQLHLMRGQFEEDKSPDAAKVDYELAAKFAPLSAATQGAAGRFFVKIQPDPERALRYYLAAYFLDPDFNDWEPVDQRVREAADAAAQARIEANADSVETLLADENPMVVAAAIQNISTTWNDRYANEFLKLTSADCPDIRDAAVQCLAAHPAAIAGALSAMLTSNDPWQRAAAVQLSAKIRSKETSTGLVPFLKDPAAVVRFDCATALIASGDTGRSAVAAAIKNEPNPAMKELISTELTQPTH